MPKRRDQGMFVPTRARSSQTSPLRFLSRGIRWCEVSCLRDNFRLLIIMVDIDYCSSRSTACITRTIYYQLSDPWNIVTSLRISTLNFMLRTFVNYYSFVTVRAFKVLLCVGGLQLMQINRQTSQRTGRSKSSLLWGIYPSSTMLIFARTAISLYEENVVEGLNRITDWKNK